MAGGGLAPMGAILRCFMLISVLSVLWSSAVTSAPHESHSDRTAVVTNQGVRGTLSGGSSQNPAINDLITVQDMAEMQGDLKQLNRLLKELGMTFYLEQSRDMTMFMPIDSAFSQLPFNIHELSWQAKWRIVQFHIIPNDVIDLDNEMRDSKEKQFESWEGAPIKVTKTDATADSTGVSSVEYTVNGEAKIISKPPKIETFNGASYKINKVLLPPSMTEDDLKPAKQDQRINPEVAQRLRRRPASEETPSPAVEQQLASVDGTVEMERSARDPRLPGSFRPDPLAQRSQQTPDFVRGVNSQHARWDDRVYHRTPRTQARDERKPQDEILGFQQEPEEAEGNQARIKVLGHRDGAVLPTDGTLPAMTRISGSGGRPSGVGMTFESSENPESAPSDPVSQFMNVLLGGGGGSTETASRPASQTTKPTEKPKQQQQEEASLFSMVMTPTEAPRVQALGLTEGLLPSEELITQHWGSSSRATQTARRSGEQQSIHSPFATLWQHIRNIPGASI